MRCSLEIRSHASALGLGLALLAFATPSRASDTPAAQGLFDQAKKLMAAHKYAEACPKFEESERLDPALGTLLNLANCYEKDGKLAKAWSVFLELTSKADAAGQRERARIGRERAAALEPRLSKIVVAVPSASASPGLEITRDGVVVGQAQLGTEIPADPGTHAVAASAPGRKAWSTTVILTEGKTSTVTVPELPLVPVAHIDEPAPPRRGPLPSRTEEGLPERTATRSGIGIQKALGLVSGGVGLVGVGIGTGFGLLSMSKHSQAHSACPDPTCPAGGNGPALWRDAVNAGNVATIAFIAGGVGLAGGAILWLTAKDAHTEPRRVEMGLGLGTVEIKGAF
jgi:hypothetical protein